MIDGYINISEAAEKWGISTRRVQVLCKNGRIEGAAKLGREWVIPATAEKPGDDRFVNGKYVACGISEISIHGLRHTHESLLLFAEVSIASVARRLGHVSMTII